MPRLSLLLVLAGCAEQSVKLAPPADTGTDSGSGDSSAPEAPTLDTAEGCTPSEAGNLVTDGGFEGGDGIPTVGSSWQGYTAGQEFGAWTVVAGSVEVVGSLMVAGAGRQWLDLDGSGPGEVEQPLATRPGAAYSLRFCLAANPYSTGTQTVEILWGGASPGVVAFDTTGMTGTDPGWVTVNVSLPSSWTPSSTTALGFRDLASDGVSYYGPALDEVSVVER